jgi:acyl dehydratase
MNGEVLDTLPATHKMRRGLPNERVVLNELSVGPLPSYLVTVTPDDVDRWAALHDDDSPWYRGPSPWGDPIAPPTILYYPSQSMLGREIGAAVDPDQPRPRSDGRGGGFARYRAEFLAPVPIGRPILVSGAITDKFVRRGMGYLTWEIEAACEGALLQRQLKSWTFSASPAELAELPERASEPRPDAGEPLADLGTLTMVIGPERTSDFEGPGELNGHSDLDLVRRLGMPGLLAQGELSFGLLYRLMRDRYGAGFVVGGAIDVRFIRPVFTTETLTARGELLGEADGQATCRLWAENSRGETVTVGTATARV